MAVRFCTPNAVGLIITRKNNDCTEILLQKRNNQWDLAAGGHVEENESLKQAAIREAREEIGIEISYKDIVFATCSYTKFEKLPYNFFYFAVKQFDGIPAIKEPGKCQELKWFHINDLPEDIISDVKVTIGNYLSGILFDELGWSF